MPNNERVNINVDLEAFAPVPARPNRVVADAAPNLAPRLRAQADLENHMWMDEVAAVLAAVHPEEIRGIDNLLMKPVKPVKKEAEFYIEWGGADLDPSFYNAERSARCGHSDLNHDKKSIDRMQAAIDKGIPVIGICRGAQILNVINGGVLVQHIDGHTKQHTIDLFNLDGILTHTNVKVTSTHHQMMVAHKDGHIVGKDPRPTTGMHWEHVNEPYEYKYVTEVVYYPKTKSLCIQPHPEWMDQQSEFIKWINNFIKTHMGLNPINFREEELKSILKWPVEVF